MKLSQAERLNNVLKQDKSMSPQKIIPAFKSDMRDIIREYGDLIGDVALEIQESIDGYNIMLVAKVSRFKSYGNYI